MLTDGWERIATLTAYDEFFHITYHTEDKLWRCDRCDTPGSWALRACVHLEFVWTNNDPALEWRTGFPINFQITLTPRGEAMLHPQWAAFTLDPTITRKFLRNERGTATQFHLFNPDNASILLDKTQASTDARRDQEP